LPSGALTEHPADVQCPHETHNTLDASPDPNAGGIKAAEEGKGEKSGVQESQANTNDLQFATFACPQTIQTRPVSDVQNPTTSYIKEKHRACACESVLVHTYWSVFSSVATVIIQLVSTYYTALTAPSWL